MDQTPTETPALPDRIDISETRTPLGGPMNQYSASRRDEDFMTWHLNYWLDLGVIGVLRGEHSILMLFRISMEHEKMNVDKFDFRAQWTKYRNENGLGRFRFWREMTVDSEEAKWYIRDIDTMLENKVEKARHYIRCKEMEMLEDLRAGRFEAAIKIFETAGDLYVKLHEEAIRDAAKVAEARNRLPNGINGVHGEQNQEAADTESDHN